MGASRQCKQPEKSLRMLLRDIERFDLALDELSMHSLIAACADAGDAQAARDLLKRITAGGLAEGVRVSIVHCGQLCKALMAGGDIDAAVEILDTMSERWQIFPTERLCAFVISQCTKSGSLERGRQVHEMMKARRVAIGVYASAALIGMYSKCGYLGEARQVFDDCLLRMGQNCQDVGVWTAMLSAYAAHGRGADALSFFDEMTQGCGVTPDEFALQAILSVCANLQDLRRREDIHKRFIGDDVGYVNQRLVAALVHMYSKCKELTRASSIFAQVKQKATASMVNVALYNMMIGGYAKNGCANEALGLFRDMVRSRVHPDRMSFLTVLPARGAVEDIETAKEIHALLICSGIAIDDEMGAGLVTMYSKCDKIDIARIAFEDVRNRHRAGTFSWTAIVGAYAQHGPHTEAFALFDAMMEQQGVRVDCVTFVAALSACKTPEMLSRGKEIHALLRRQGIAMDEEVTAALVTMYSNCGSVEGAKSFFQGTSQRSLGVSTWNAMLSALVSHSLTHEAWALYEEMVGGNNEISPASSTFSVMLRLCGELGTLKRGIDMHRQIVEKGIEIDDILGASLITMYGRNGQLATAVSLFSELEKTSTLAGRVSTYTAMIAAYGDYRKVDEAFELFDHMDGIQGPLPDKITYSGVLTACSHAGDVAKALESVHTMQSRHGIRPDVIHHNCIIDAMGRSGRLEEAEAYLHAHPDASTDPVSWVTLLGACRSLNYAERAEAMTRNLAPNLAGSHILMANIYANVGQWQESARVRQVMGADRVRKVPRRSIIDIGAGEVHEFIAADTSRGDGISSDLQQPHNTEEEKASQVSHSEETRQC